MNKTHQAPLTLRGNKELKGKLLKWWQSMALPESELRKKEITPAPSGMKAQLKRCHSIETSMFSEGFRTLWFSLFDEPREQDKPEIYESWATIAAALVFVKEDSGTTLAKAAGSKGDGDKSVVSEMRFSQLQSSKTPDDFLLRLRRILQQLDGKVSVYHLALDIEQWLLEYHQFRPQATNDRIGIKWAMDYYQAAKATKSK